MEDSTSQGCLFYGVWDACSYAVCSEKASHYIKLTPLSPRSLTITATLPQHKNKTLTYLHHGNSKLCINLTTWLSAAFKDTHLSGSGSWLIFKRKSYTGISKERRKASKEGCFNSSLEGQTVWRSFNVMSENTTVWFLCWILSEDFSSDVILHLMWDHWRKHGVRLHMMYTRVSPAERGIHHDIIRPIWAQLSAKSWLFDGF